MTDHDLLCPMGLLGPLGLSKIAACLCPEFSAVRQDKSLKAYERGAADERERIAQAIEAWEMPIPSTAEDAAYRDGRTDAARIARNGGRDD